MKNLKGGRPLKTEDLDERVLPYLKEHQKQQRKKWALSLLSVGTAMCVFAVMMHPGVSLGASAVSLRSSRPTVKPGETVCAEVSADAEQATVFVLESDGGACLADNYAFAGGETTVATTAGGTVTLHESTGTDTPEYWFALDAGQKADFALCFREAAPSGSGTSAADRAQSDDTAAAAQPAAEAAETPAAQQSSAEQEVPAVQETPAAAEAPADEGADSAAAAAQPAAADAPTVEAPAADSAPAAESVPAAESTADTPETAAAAESTPAQAESTPAPESLPAENVQAADSAPAAAEAAPAQAESTAAAQQPAAPAQSGTAAESAAAPTAGLRAVCGATLEDARAQLGDPDAGSALTLTWSEDAAEAEEPLTRQTLTAVLYKDSSDTEVSQDGTQITVTGSLPEGACVKASPISPQPEGYAVYAAYDITVYRADGTVFEPESGTVQVCILSPQIPEDGCAVYYVPETGSPEPMQTTEVDGGVQFEADHFSPYIVAAKDLTPTVTVSTFSALQTAVAAGGTQVIRLGGDITADAGLTFPSGTDITIDLNGHCLTNSAYSGALFNITGGALTLADSAAVTETAETVTTGNKYANAATAAESGGRVTLTYYVTQTAVADSGIGSTTETLVKHTVSTGGYVKNGSYGSLISLSDGSFSLQSGMLYGGSYNLLAQSGGTASLTGGFICGVQNNYTQNGGAVGMTGGTLNITGSAVLAANTASHYGGAVYAEGTGTVIHVGETAVISGNTAAAEGGGIYTQGTVTLADSAYLTNNISSNGYVYGGGGGLFLAGDAAQLAMSGGYVTGNWSNTTGGGIGMEEHGDSGSGVTLSASITGGFISGNVANADEGGGLAVRGADTCTMSGGYITNNSTLTTRDWGGGGVFVSENGKFSLSSALITDNRSDSFGAGISACSTGKIYLYVEDGAAVYGNTAGSNNPENDAKNEGYTYTYGNTVFLSSGYQDLFCVHQSTVTGGMLGGGSSNWSGSSASCGTDAQASAVIAATKAVSAGQNDVLTADSLMGLTASPSQQDIAKAQGSAKVYINGNSSSTHGGGIMSNGSLILGKPVDLTLPAKLTLAAGKTFTDSDSGAAVSLSSNGFSFVIADSSGATVSTGTCDENGGISFSPALSISPGQSRFTVTEVQTGRADVVYDSAVYTLTVTAEQGSGTQNEDTGTLVYQTVITGITLTKSTDSGFGKTLSPNASDYTLTAADGGIVFANKSKPSETVLNTSVAVTKTWSDGNDAHSGDSVTVHLLSDGADTGMTGVLNAADKWSFTFSGLPYYEKDGTTPVTYSVSEDGVTGYTASYRTTSETPPTATVTSTTVQSFEDGRVYSISSGTAGYALAVKESSGTYSLVSAKVSSGDTAQLWKAVAGAPPEGYPNEPQTGWFYLENVKYPGEWLHFYYQSHDTTQGEKMDLSTTPQTTFNISSSGVLYTKHLFSETWYGKGVTISSEGIGFSIGFNDSVSGDKLTYRSASVKDGLTALEVTNTAAGYTLPNTGSSGCMPFALSGLVLTLVPAALALRRERRRRGGSLPPG